MIGSLHVCRSCQTRDAVRRSSGPAASSDLQNSIAAMLRGLPDPAAFKVALGECLGPCSAGVRVAVTGSGRWGWLFQGLQPGADVDALAAFLLAWQAAPDGLPAKSDRPTRLLRKTIGRLPPSGVGDQPAGTV